MKIAILTLPFHINYGGILQAWALNSILKNMGHQVFFIKNRHRSSFRTICRFILGRISKEEFLISINRHKYYNIYKMSFDKFTHNNLKFIRKSDINQMDVVIVGSDQIWRKYYYPLTDAFLAFAKKNKIIKRIAYAASFGVNEWEYTDKETSQIISLIALFGAISVREKDGVRMCKEKLLKTPEFVLDPTMLIDVSEYNILSENIEKRNGKCLFSFVLDPTEDKINTLKKINSELQATVIELKMWDNDNIFEHQLITYGIEYWLSCFRDADFVFTDSFHGCVFSILFNKPFIVYGNNSRGLSRFISLLETFDIRERYIAKSSELSSELLYRIINWDGINDRLRELKDYSIEFLKKNL
ncbi:MurB family protein [Bacteroidia bacterium]|nr:MurB family protein [Bacteroidia bacterium]